MSKQYEKQAKFLELGIIYIQESGKKFGTLSLGGQNVMFNLEPIEKKFENMVNAGKMDASEAAQEVEKLLSKGAKYRMKAVIEQ